MQRKRDIITLPFILLGCTSVGTVALYFWWRTHFILFLIPGILTVLLFLWSLYSIYVWCRLTYMIRNNRITVTVDQLLDKKERLKHLSIRLHHVHYFYFTHLGKHLVQDVRLHAGNDTVYIPRQQQYEQAEIGDTYYVVAYKNNILCLYNTKTFEYKDPTPMNLFE